MAAVAKVASAYARPQAWMKLRLAAMFGIPKKWALIIALVILVPTVVGGILAPWIAPFDPERAKPLNALQPPNGTHWLGTDRNGMDILSRLLYAPRVDLPITVVGVALGLVVGVPAGIAMGFWRAPGVEILMRALDVFQAFPFLILAMVVIAVTSGSMWNIAFVLAFHEFPIYLRLTRGEVLVQRSRKYITAARMVGNPDHRIILRHLLPNSIGPVMAQMPISLAVAILLIAGLSFIGLGVEIPTPEWGAMLADGAKFALSGKWWVFGFPGIALILVIMAVTLLGEVLEDQMRRQ